jgi:transcriptional regulator with XRE-family HTH domain
MATRRRRGVRRSTKTTETDRDYCRIDGGKLRKLRLDAELTIRALAYAVDVDPKTITDIEAGRRERSQIRVARSIAAHPDINVDWTELLPEGDKRRPQTTIALAPRSSLDALVDEERRIGKPEPVNVGSSLIPVFSASDLVNVFASPGSHAGERFCVTGLVHAQRGLPPADAAVLGVDYERCARFELVRTIGSVERPLAVTVTTTSASQTRALQRAWEKRSTVGVLVGLGAVSFRDPSEVVIDGMPGAATRLVRPRPSPGAEPWRGFLHIEEKSERPPKPHPWTLIIVEVLYG